MIKNKPREIVVVYTKQFPFGFKEAYILDEIDALRESFDEIYFLPYAEFNFESKEVRISLDNHFHVLDFGATAPDRSTFQKLTAAFNILPILLAECLFSRQKLEALKRSKQNFLRLYHYSWIAHQLKNWLNSKNENITHYHYWMHDGVMIEKLAGSKKPSRHVARAHSIDCYHKDWPLNGYAPYEIQKINRLDAIYSVSQHGLRHLKKTFPSLTHKFHYQPLGIPIEARPAISQNPSPIMLTIAFMGKVKNMGRMVDLMQELKEDFSWVHIGSGVEEIQQEVIAACKSRGIAFQSLGYLNKEEIFNFLKKNEVAFFANTSIWEGVPVSLMEAGMFGIPFIVSDIPGNLEIVNKDNGFVIPLKGDLSAIAKQMKDCFHDKAQWERYAKAAQTKIVDDYNAEKNHRVFFEKIKKLSLK
jgi:glycosyltransferase involved in cell wall biosynthesis